MLEVGYDQQVTTLLASSVAQVKQDEINESCSLQAARDLLGSASGVIVVNHSGAPGDNVSVNIHGIRTKYNAEPLYVVDGMALSLGTSIDFLNPSDIEQIEILKDTGSAAMEAEYPME